MYWIFIFNQICLLIVKCIYTIVFHFTYAFLPIVALISFIPTGSTPLLGPIKASIWCFLVPIICATILCAIGSIIEPPKVVDDYLYYDFQTYIQLSIFSLMLLSVSMIARSLVSGEGFQKFGDEIGKMARFATAMNFSKNITRAGKDPTIDSSKRLFHAGKNKAIDFKTKHNFKNKGINLTGGLYGLDKEKMEAIKSGTAPSHSNPRDGLAKPIRKSKERYYEQKPC